MAGMARLPPIWNASVIYHELSTHLDLEQLYIHQHDSLINIHTHASNNNEPDNWQSPLVMLYIRTTCSWLVSTNSQRVSCVAIIFSCFFIIFSVRNSRRCDREDGEGRERERERERGRDRGKERRWMPFNQYQKSGWVCVSLWPSGCSCAIQSIMPVSGTVRTERRKVRKGEKRGRQNNALSSSASGPTLPPSYRIFWKEKLVFFSFRFSSLRACACIYSCLAFIGLWQLNSQISITLGYSYLTEIWGKRGNGHRTHPLLLNKTWIHSYKMNGYLQDGIWK